MHYPARFDIKVFGETRQAGTPALPALDVRVNSQAPLKDNSVARPASFQGGCGSRTSYLSLE